MDVPKSLMGVSNLKAWALWLREHSTPETVLTKDVYYAYRRGGAMSLVMRKKFKLHVIAVGGKPFLAKFYKFCHQMGMKDYLARKHVEMEAIKNVYPEVKTTIDVPAAMIPQMLTRITAILDTVGIPRELLHRVLGQKFGVLVEKLHLPDDVREKIADNLEKGILEDLKRTRIMSLCRLNASVWRLISHKQKMSSAELVKLVGGFSKVVRDYAAELEGETPPKSPEDAAQLDRDHKEFLEMFKETEKKEETKNGDDGKDV